MNPNDPQQNPLNNDGNQTVPPQDPTVSGVVNPTPGAAPQDSSQPQSAAQPDPMAMPQPTTFAPQDPTVTPAAPVMSGDMSGAPAPTTPTPAAMPTPDANMPGQSNVPMGMASPASGMDSKKRRIVMFAVLLLALVVLVGGGYYAVKQYQKNHDKSTTNAAAKKSESSTSAPDINTLASFTLVQPPASKLTGYTVTAGSTTGETTISAPIGSDTNNACEISFGTFGQSDLPGTDIGDVVSKETTILKNDGVTVSGPNVIKALVLKNASTSATYSIPSVNFSYTKDGITEVANYSISELKDQSHAAVLQVCAGKDTVANLTSKLNSELVPVAEAITVKTN